MTQSELGTHRGTIKATLPGLILGDIGGWFGFVLLVFAGYSLYTVVMALFSVGEYDLASCVTAAVISGLLAFVLLRRIAIIWKNSRFEFYDNGFVYYYKKKPPQIVANSDIVDVDSGPTSSGGFAVWAKTIKADETVWVKKGHYESGLIDWLYDAYQRGMEDSER